jgi:hypothetical protein
MCRFDCIIKKRSEFFQEVKIDKKFGFYKRISIYKLHVGCVSGLFILLRFFLTFI